MAGCPPRCPFIAARLGPDGIPNHEHSKDPPFVEESLYRGYAFGRLQERYGVPLAVIISCTFFGLLHWAGGFWYILLTGVVAGGLFAALRLWRGTLIAPFAAHLALNILEFLWIVQARSGLSISLAAHFH